MYKLILFFLFIACKVQGQQVDTAQIPPVDNIYIYTQKGWKEIDRNAFNTLQLEIQTLRLLNDSLTKKLQLLLEWQELACPIIESVGVVKTVNGYRLLVNKREMIKPAVRYYKRYKPN